MDAAWLEWNGQLMFAEYRRAAFEPHSAVTVLINGIWRLFPDLAHFMLRSRIFMNYEPTELCRGMIIVCAKRYTRLPAVPLSVEQRIKSGDKNSIRISNSAQVAASHSSVDASGGLALQHRSVEAWLLDSEGRLVASGVNTAGRNRTCHAEMNLLRSWWKRTQRALPADGRLICTLEPCPMCAGAIVQCLESQARFKIEFLDPDPGSAIRRSVLRNSPILHHCRLLEHSDGSQD